MFRFLRRSSAALPWLAQRIRPAAARAGRATVDLFFPPRCACCDAELPEHEDLMLCEDCTHAMGPETWPGCRRCGAIVPGQQSPPECGDCRGRRLRIDAVVPLGSYDGPLREAVLKMKRPAHESLSVALGRLLAQRRATALAEFHPDLIVPIPMHWWRRLGRGVNSPEIVARCVARPLGVAVRRLLVRRRNTLPQKDLPPDQRFRNVRGAFRIRGNPARLKDSHVLLIDDILTTGATCSEAARTLKQAGAAVVTAAVVAKAQGPY